MDEFEKWLDGYMEHEQDREIFWSLNLVMGKYRSFKAKAEEPLAVLADRFNYAVEIHNNDGAEDDYWNIVLDEVGLGMTNTKLFQATTYSAAEQAAREWLNKQEDK